jgi:hypothetical protein
MKHVMEKDLREGDYIVTFLCHVTFGKNMVISRVLNSRSYEGEHHLILRPISEFTIFCDNFDLSVEHPLKGIVSMVSTKQIRGSNGDLFKLDQDEIYRHILMETI